MGQEPLVVWFHGGGFEDDGGRVLRTAILVQRFVPVVEPQNFCQLMLVVALQHLWSLIALLIRPIIHVPIAQPDILKIVVPAVY